MKTLNPRVLHVCVFGPRCLHQDRNRLGTLKPDVHPGCVPGTVFGNSYRPRFAHTDCLNELGSPTVDPASQFVRMTPPVKELIDIIVSRGWRYVREYHFRNHPNVQYDVALPSLCCVIEVHSKYHDSKSRIARDKYKAKLARSFGWKFYYIRPGKGESFKPLFSRLSRVESLYDSLRDMVGHKRGVPLPDLNRNPVLKKAVEESTRAYRENKTPRKPRP